jgi:hypothetical protein
MWSLKVFEAEGRVEEAVEAALDADGEEDLVGFETSFLDSSALPSAQATGRR